MTATRKEVELRITANDLGNKTLEELVKTFEDLKKAQEQYTKSGNAASKQVSELKQELTDLKSIGQQLQARAGLIDAFDLASQASEKAAKRVVEAKAAYEAFQATIKDGEKLTSKQAASNAALAKSLSSAEKSLASATNQAQKFKEKLSEIGVADTKAAATGLVSFAGNVGEALQKSEQSIRAYDAALRQKKETETAAAISAKNLAEAQQAQKLAQEELAKKTVFNKIGTDALTAANSIDVLTRDFDKLAASGKKGGDGIRAILDPSKEAIRTLTGLESEITSLNSKLDAAQKDTGLKKQITALRGEYLGLAQDAGKAAVKMADDIGKYRQQKEALESLQQQFLSAQSAVKQYAQQVAAAQAPNETLRKTLAESQTQLNGFVVAVEREAAALSQTKASLRAAGVDTNNLVEAENRLKVAATQSAAAQDLLGASHRKVGKNANDAGNGLGFFEDKGRTSLSLIQRLRGQILSLAASYTGLFGAIQLVQKAIENSVAFQHIEIGLRVVSEGDKKKAKEDVDYVKAQAERLGLVFTEVGDQFTKIAFAGKAAGLSDKAVKATFEAFAEAGKVFNLTTEEINGVFLALQQGLSTGRIKAQDLNQLAQRLPGAFALIAEALKKPEQSLKDFKKELQDPDKGFDASGFVLFAQRYRKAVAEELPESTKSLTSEINRLKNAVNELLEKKFGGNLETTLRDLVSRLVEFFKSDDGSKFADNLVTTFSNVFQVLKVVVDFANEIALSFKILLGLKVAAYMLELAAATSGAAAAAGTLSTALTLLGTGLTAVIKGAAAFFVGFQIGKFLYENFYVVRAVAGNIIAIFDSMFRVLPDLVSSGWAQIQEIFFHSLATILTFVGSSVGKIGEFLGSAFSALSNVPGLEKLADASKTLFEIGKKNVSSLADGYEQKASDARKRIANANKRIGEEATRFKSNLLQVSLTDPNVAPGSPANKAAGATTLSQAELDAIKNNIELKGDKKKHDPLDTLANSLRQRVSKILQDLDLAESESLDKQLASAKQKFAVLEADLDKLAKAGKTITIGDETFQISEVKELIAKNEKVIEQKITQKYYQKQITEAQKEFNDLTGASKDTIEAVNDRFLAGTITRQEALDKLAANDANYAERIKASGEKLIKIVNETPKDVLQHIGGEKLVADVEKGTAAIAELESKTRQSTFTKDILKQQKELNDLLEVRRAKIELINNEVSLGLKTNREGQKEAREVNLQYSATILERADALRDELLNLPPDIFEKLGAQRMIADIEKSVIDVKALKTEAQQLGVQLQTQFGEGAANAFVTMGKEIGKSVQGAQSLGEAFRNTGRAFLQFASDFLLNIAQMIAKRAILNALEEASANNEGGGAGGFFGMLAGAIAGSAHTGAVVGNSGTVPMPVNPLWFANAPRFHGGGFPGLRNDEIPIIAQRGEEILKKSDPRNAMNGGKNPANTGTRVVNVLDPELARDYLESSAGEKVLLNIIGRNPSAVKQMLR